jgi:hypothetical protein
VSSGRVFGRVLVLALAGVQASIGLLQKKISFAEKD